jgi:hypothetical protein
MGFNSGLKGLMHGLKKKVEKSFTSKFVGAGPSSYEKEFSGPWSHKS